MTLQIGIKLVAELEATGWNLFTNPFNSVFAFERWWPDGSSDPTKSPHNLLTKSVHVVDECYDQLQRDNIVDLGTMSIERFVAANDDFPTPMENVGENIV